MSGPKGYSYSVESAELKRQQAVSSARSRCEALWRRVNAEVAQVRAMGGVVADIDRPPVIAGGASEAQAGAAASEFERRAQGVTAACQRQRAIAVASRFQAHLPRRLAATVDIAWSAAPAAARDVEPARAAEVAAATSEQLDTLAARFFEALAQVDDDRTRSAWFADASLLVQSPSPTTATLRTLTSLEREVGQRLRAQAQENALRAEAEQVALSIADVVGALADRARGDLAAVHDRASLKAAAAVARSAREEHIAVREREFVIEQTVQALRELGYTVDESFREAAVAGEFAVATSGRLPDHGLQFKFPAAENRILTNAVAVTDCSTTEQDVAAEEATCADLGDVERQVNERGVRLQRQRQQPPGAVPIERKVGRARTRSAARSGERPNESTRTAGRPRPAVPRERER